MSQQPYMTTAEIESAVLAGKDIDPALLAEARQREDAQNHIARLKTVRNERLAAERRAAEKTKQLTDAAEEFAELRDGADLRLHESWLNISAAIKEYAEAVQGRNEKLKALHDLFQGEANNPTPGVVLPFRAEASNDSVTVNGKTLRFVDALPQVQKVMGLTLGQMNPLLPEYGRHGGIVAALESGIVKKEK